VRYLSVCSGIEAATVAWHHLGWQPVAFSEIEPFPCKVLAHHYPDVPNLGDMTKFKEWPDANIDVLVGGTPCQSFSIAGLRKGLDDPRGNLMLTYLAIAAKYRPEWVVWENVPGVLSSNAGRDFGTFLGGLAELEYGFAYRVLDAQFVRTDGHPYAVPQRRRRVFVVGHLGDWRRAAAVLFDSESLRGNPPPSREAGKEVAGTFKARARSGGWSQDVDLAASGYMLPVSTFDRQSSGEYGTAPVASTMSRRDYKSPSDLVLPINTQIATRHEAMGEGTGMGIGEDGSAAYTLQAAHSHAVAFRINAAGQVNEQDGISASLGTQTDPCAQILAVGNETLYDKGIRQGDNHASTQKTYAGALLRRVRDEIGAEAFAKWGLGILDSFQSPEVLRSALHGSELRQATFSRRWMVCCALGSPFTRAEGALQSLREACGARCPPQGWESLEQLAGQLGTYLSELSQPGAQAERFMHDMWQASEGLGLLRQALSKVQEIRRPAHVQTESAQSVMQVRRLTPECCEFLQGFPRGYTNIPGASDSARYKALGNSMAVNVMQLIGERIQMVDDIK